MRRPRSSVQQVGHTGARSPLVYAPAGDRARLTRGGAARVFRCFTVLCPVSASAALVGTRREHGLVTDPSPSARLRRVPGHDQAATGTERGRCGDRGHVPAPTHSPSSILLAVKWIVAQLPGPSCRRRLLPCCPLARLLPGPSAVSVHVRRGSTCSSSPPSLGNSCAGKSRFSTSAAVNRHEAMSWRSFLSSVCHFANCGQMFADLRRQAQKPVAHHQLQGDHHRDLLPRLPGHASRAARFPPPQGTHLGQAGQMQVQTLTQTKARAKPAGRPWYRITTTTAW